MSSTTFINGTTIIDATWLNDVNVAVYTTLPTKAPSASPTLTTPNIGVATATSINKVTITQPATGSTLTVPDGTVATVSGTNTGDQLTFKTISVIGQSDVVADSLTDTLTLVGSGVAITTNAATDTITFTAAGASLVRSARTSNTILGLSDSATFIDITSGTFTQTFTAAATLGSGWWCYIRNSGTGDITLDPNSTELIDGLTSYIMYSGEARLIQCDGTAFTSVVMTPYQKNFITSGTWTKPPGYQTHGGIAWSAGASGRKAGAGTIGQGGSGGGAFPFTIPASSMGSTETVTIGAGGTNVTTVLAGNSGGNTSLGSFLTVFGGFFNSTPGAIGITAAATASTINGNAVGFEAPLAGSFGLNAVWGGSSTSNNATANSGSSIYGGASGGSVDASGVLWTAGTSQFGGNGGAASAAGSGVNGGIPAGGGGGTQTGTQSGAGGRGELRIWGIV